MSDGQAIRTARAAKRTEALVVDAHPEWERLALAIRRQVEACVELDTANADVAALADAAEALAGRLEEGATGKRVGLVEEGWRGRPEDDRLDYLPFSPIMGRLNPASYGLSIRREGDRAVGRVVLNETEEGAVGLAHGGVIAGIWDEVLAAANSVAETGGPTALLTIRYRKPTPLHEPLVYTAWVERVSDRKILVKGECALESAPDEVLTEAEGLFIAFVQASIDWHGDRERENVSTD